MFRRKHRVSNSQLETVYGRKSNSRPFFPSNATVGENPSAKGYPPCLPKGCPPNMVKGLPILCVPTSLQDGKIICYRLKDNP
jgi:hypothetical protein